MRFVSLRKLIHLGITPSFRFPTHNAEKRGVNFSPKQKFIQYIIQMVIMTNALKTC